jgi:6-phosphogluconolactonase
VAQSASRVICANYSGGSVAAFSTRDDGGVGSRSGLAQFSGSGPNVARQEKAHAHQCVPAKSGRMVYVPDLGADQLRQLRLTEDGAFEELPAFVFETLPGGGPRHIAFNPTKADVCYCLHELGNVISVLSLRQSLVVAVEQVVSTLPADYVGSNLGADVHVSPDGKFVYASNRGHDSIAIFKVDMCTGHLSLAGCVAAGGNTPRNFAITPDGEFVLVALQVCARVCLSDLL